jgi:hypothetical protein
VIAVTLEKSPARAPPVYAVVGRTGKGRNQADRREDEVIYTSPRALNWSRELDPFARERPR